MPRSVDFKYIALLIGILALLSVSRVEGPIDLRYDGGVYYVLGTSLAEGHGYRLLNEPGQVEAVQYPPALPALVAVHQLVLGTWAPVLVGQWLKWTFLILNAVYVLCSFALARRFLGPGLSFLTAVVCALSVHTYFLTNLCFAEIPFALSTVLFALLLDRRRRGSVPAGAALAIIATLLRSVGIALLLAWVADRLLRRRFKQAAVAAGVSLIVVGAWQGYVASVTASEDYREPAYEYQRAPYQHYSVPYTDNILLVDPFRPELGRADLHELTRRIAFNLAQLPLTLGEGVSVPRGFWDWMTETLVRRLGGTGSLDLLVRFLLVSLGALVAWGMVLQLRSGQLFMPMYVIGSTALVSLTPWPEEAPRYMAPLTPFLTISFCYALMYLRGVEHRSWRRGAMYFTTAIVAIVITVQTYTALRSFLQFHPEVQQFDAEGNSSTSRVFFYDRTWRECDASLKWLGQHAQPEEIVATSVPHLTFLRTGLRAVLPPFVVDVEEAQRLLDGVPVAYVIIDELEFRDMSRRYAGPAVRAHPDLWELVHSSDGGGLSIYRRLR